MENHRFFTSFDKTSRGRRTERMLLDVMGEVSFSGIDGSEFLLAPGADFDALFLTRHAQGHFVSEGIALRHVCDWAMFLSASRGVVDWEMVYRRMDECGMGAFADVMTGICVRYLGLVVDDGVRVSGDVGLMERVMADILGPQPSVFERAFYRKCLRILRRFGRMWRFRGLLHEGYFRLVWNTFAFASILGRKVEG